MYFHTPFHSHFFSPCFHCQGSSEGEWEGWGERGRGRGGRKEQKSMTRLFCQSEGPKYSILLNEERGNKRVPLQRSWWVLLSARGNLWRECTHNYSGGNFAPGCKESVSLLCRWSWGWYTTSTCIQLFDGRHSELGLYTLKTNNKKQNCLTYVAFFSS